MVVSWCVVSSPGNPKGAMLTHENVVADAAGVMKAFEVQKKKKKKKQQPFRGAFWFIVCLYLPLSPFFAPPSFSGLNSSDGNHSIH